MVTPFFRGFTVLSGNPGRLKFIPLLIYFGKDNKSGKWYFRDFLPYLCILYSLFMNNVQNILKLSTAERLLLLEKLWNSIIPNEITIRDSHKKELDKRLSRMKRGETKFYTWDEVKKNLHGK
jgi:putative addiction module component (TIGR02574 family)